MVLKSIFAKRVKTPGLRPTDDGRFEYQQLSHLIHGTGSGSTSSLETPIQPDSGAEHEPIINEIDTSDWPPATEYDPEHPTTDPFLGDIRRTDEHLDIKVGKGKFVQRWRVHKDLICQYSGYFRQVCHSASTAEASFQEANEGIFDLHDDNPAAFELFLDWLYSNKNEPAQDTAYQLSYWNIYPVEVYALGDKLMVDAFRPFALKHAINSARYFDQRDIEIVFELTGSHDPLYKFTCRWLRWRCREDPCLWRRSRNEIFQGERQRKEPAISVTGKDPREFEAEHWFQPCCEVGRICEHQEAATDVPFYRRERDARLAKARLQRAWIRRKAYGYRFQFMSILAAYGSYVDCLSAALEDN